MALYRLMLDENHRVNPDYCLPPSLEDLVAGKLSESSSVLLAKPGDLAAAVLTVEQANREATVLTGLYVREDCRGKSLGWALMERGLRISDAYFTRLVSINLRHCVVGTEKVLVQMGLKPSVEPDVWTLDRSAEIDTRLKLGNAYLDQRSMGNWGVVLEDDDTIQIETVANVLTPLLGKDIAELATFVVHVGGSARITRCATRPEAEALAARIESAFREHGHTVKPTVTAC